MTSASRIAKLHRDLEMQAKDCRACRDGRAVVLKDEHLEEHIAEKRGPCPRCGRDRSHDMIIVLDRP